MILPLGLGFKFIRFPYVTLALCLISIAVYVHNPARSHQISKAISQQFQTLDIGLLENKLFKEYCLAEGGKKNICSEIGEMIEEGYETSKNNRAEKKEHKSDKSDLLSIESDDNQIFYLSIFKSFKSEIKNPDSQFEQLAGYQPFFDNYEVLKERIEKYYKNENVLSAKTITPQALLFSQFSHGSFIHLLGNLLLLFIFGAYVEQRLSQGIYAGIYLVAGSLGLMGHVMLKQEPIQFLVGASANVSAIMGMFFIFFFRSQIKFMIWYITGKIFYAPVSVAFPVLYVFQELVLGLDKGDGIAHFAHLGGFFIGAWAAFIVDSFKPIAWPLLYPQEKKDMEAIRKEQDIYKKIENADVILKYNPQNFLVRDLIIDEIFLNDPSARLLDSRVAEFLKIQGPMFMSQKLSSNQIKKALLTLNKCPYGISLEVFLNKCDSIDLLKTGDTALLDNQAVLAMRVYDYFILKFPNSPTLLNLTRTIKEALRIILIDFVLNSELKAYLTVARSSAIPGFINEVTNEDEITQVSGGSYGFVFTKN